MSEFISTGIVILIIAAVIGLAIRSRKKSREMGASCCGDCAACREKAGKGQETGSTSTIK